MNDRRPAARRPIGQSWPDELPPTGALIGDVPGRGHLAIGPLEPVARPPHGQPSLYVPDFFLEDPEPWRMAQAWQEVLWQASPPSSMPLGVEWERPDRERWEAAFREAHEAFDSGDLEKVVPVVLAKGRVKSGYPSAESSERARELVGRAVAHACNSAGTLTPYALWGESFGVAGVSPEPLFRVHRDGVVETLALAGTVPPEAAESLLEDPKLRHEHEVVVRFITTALARFGPVCPEPMRILRLPHLAHLATPITLRSQVPPTFESLVAALHPTPALGGLPRAEALARLRTLDRATTGEGRRGGFGAPFGVRFADGSGFCVVAIRNITWRDDTVGIRAGAGLVGGSVLETEWDELCRKIEAVRRVFDP